MENKPLREREDLTVLWNYIPGLTAYQVLFILLVSIYEFSAGSLQVAQIILQVSPDNITCVKSGTIGCNATCEAYDYDFALFNNTVISEFGLVCDKDTYPARISSLSLFGLFFGAITTGFASDRYGRKKVILVATAGGAVFSALTSLASTNVYYYTFFRMVTGAFVNGAGTISITWLMEFVAVPYRSWVTAISYFFFDVGIANLSLVGYLFPNWREQSLAITILPVLGFIVALIMPESIIYLYGAGKFNEGKKELKSLMQRANADVTQLEELSHKMETISSSSSASNRGNASDLLKPHYRPVALKCSFLVFAGAMGSMGMFLDSSGDASKLLINNVWLSLFDSFGYLAIPPALDYFGRVKTHVWSFGLIGVALIASYFTKQFFLVNYLLVNFAKLINAVAFGGIFNFTNELFPTYLRSSMMGMASAMGRLGGMLAPLILELAKLHPILPPIILAVVCFIAAFVSSSLPETKGKALPQSTEDALELYGISKPVEVE